MGLLLERVFRIYNESQLLPLIFIATRAGVVLVFGYWLLAEFHKPRQKIFKLTSN